MKAPEPALLLWGGILNGTWEFLQSPLFTDHIRGPGHVLWTRLHCTVGDILILLAAFWITSGIFGTRAWIFDRRAARFLFYFLGFSYTVGSEWFHTTVAGTWEYSAAMPQILGIGVAPLLQWLFIPPIVLALVRRSC